MTTNTVLIILIPALGYLLGVYGLLWLAKATERHSRPQG